MQTQDLSIRQFLQDLGLDQFLGIPTQVHGRQFLLLLIYGRTWDISRLYTWQVSLELTNPFMRQLQLMEQPKCSRSSEVTLPMLKPTVITLTLMSIGRIFYSDFGLFYQVPQNSGALFNVTQTIDTYVYRGLMELNDVGMSAAAGLYQSLVGFALVLIANAIVRKIDSDNALF